MIYKLIKTVCIGLLFLTCNGCGFEQVIPSVRDRSLQWMNHDLEWKDEKSRELCKQYIGEAAHRVQADWGPPNPDHISKTIRSYRKNETWLRGEVGGWWEPISVDESWTYTRLRSKEHEGHTHEYNVTFFLKDGVVVWVEIQ